MEGNEDDQISQPVNGFTERKEGNIERVSMADHYRSLVQKMYIAKEKLINKSVEKIVDSLDMQIGEKMKPECKLSIGVPAYKEGYEVKKLLENTIVGQEDLVGNPIDQDEVEYLIFLNCDQNSELDADTEKGIIEFIDEHEEINVHLVKSKIEYPIKKIGSEKGKIQRKMGLIYKILGDLIVKRNTEREADQSVKANHIMKTGGVDARGRSRRYVDNTINALSNTDIVQCKSVAELPRFINERFPSLAFAAHMEDRMNQVFNDRIVGLGAYRTWLYTEAGGFNKDINIGEEVDLSSKISKVIDRSKGVYGLGINTQIKELRTGTVNAIDNPDRFLFAHKKGLPAVNRYDFFEGDESEFRRFDFDSYIRNNNETTDIFEARINNEMQILMESYLGEPVMLKNHLDGAKVELPNIPIGESENEFIKDLEEDVEAKIRVLSSLISEYNNKEATDRQVFMEPHLQRVDDFFAMNIDELCENTSFLLQDTEISSDYVGMIQKASSVLGVNSVRELVSFINNDFKKPSWKAAYIFTVDAYKLNLFLEEIYFKMCNIKFKAKDIQK
jgi:hypothetical protein